VIDVHSLTTGEAAKSVISSTRGCGLLVLESSRDWSFLQSVDDYEYLILEPPSHKIGFINHFQDLSSAKSPKSLTPQPPRLMQHHEGSLRESVTFEKSE
jgi:hypothetical protein